MKVLLRLLTMLSVFGILGTIGAFDTESITVFQTFVQLIFSGLVFWASTQLMKNSNRNVLKKALSLHRPQKPRYSARRASDVA